MQEEQKTPKSEINPLLLPFSIEEWQAVEKQWPEKEKELLAFYQSLFDRFAKLKEIETPEALNEKTDVISRMQLIILILKMHSSFVAQSHTVAQALNQRLVLMRCFGAVIKDRFKSTASVKISPATLANLHPQFGLNVQPLPNGGAIVEFHEPEWKMSDQGIIIGEKPTLDDLKLPEGL